MQLDPCKAEGVRLGRTAARALHGALKLNSDLILPQRPEVGEPAGAGLGAWAGIGQSCAARHKRASGPESSHATRAFGAPGSQPSSGSGGSGHRSEQEEHPSWRSRTPLEIKAHTVFRACLSCNMFRLRVEAQLSAVCWGVRQPPDAGRPIRAVTPRGLDNSLTKILRGMSEKEHCADLVAISLMHQAPSQAGGCRSKQPTDAMETADRHGSIRVQG